MQKLFPLVCSICLLLTTLVLGKTNWLFWVVDGIPVNFSLSLLVLLLLLFLIRPPCPLPFLLLSKIFCSVWILLIPVVVDPLVDGTPSDCGWRFAIKSSLVEGAN